MINEKKYNNLIYEELIPFKLENFKKYTEPLFFKNIKDKRILFAVIHEIFNNKKIKFMVILKDLSDQSDKTSFQNIVFQILIKDLKESPKEKIEIVNYIKRRVKETIFEKYEINNDILRFTIH